MELFSRVAKKHSINKMSEPTNLLPINYLHDVCFLNDIMLLRTSVKSLTDKYNRGCLNSARMHSIRTLTFYNAFKI
jgi:hypothetical protein